MEHLEDACVVVVGLGGVGSFCAEALARSGIGHLRLVDHDVVSPTNLNRQLHAMSSTLGLSKAECMAGRLRDAISGIDVDVRRVFFDAETADSLLEVPVDVVVDAIDSLGPKVELLAQCCRRGIPVITALGAGGRLDPTRVRTGPLAKTQGDPLASRVRKMLRRRGSIDGVMAVYSEEPCQPIREGFSRFTDDLVRGRQRVIQPSCVMVPAAMGLAAAAHVVGRLAGGNG